jgi:hypothetical protein
MSGAATPGFFKFERESEQNGNITWYEFHVQTTNYLVPGDRIYIDLPYPAYFSEDTDCTGRTANVNNVQQCRVSVNLSRIALTLSLPNGYSSSSRRDRELQSAVLDGQISQGEEFIFRVSNIKNPPSFQPTTESINYSVYTANGVLMEDLTEGFPIINNVPGDLSQYQNGLLPGDFRSSFETNYTLEVYLENYEQNMNIILTLPPEISFATDTIVCEGLQGTDSKNVTCLEDRENKQINFTDAVTFQRGNPGTIRINIQKLKNPIENIVTSSFKIETYTDDGWKLDEIATNITVNFYCNYPCASCNEDDEEQCNSCYSAAFENLFYDFSCYGQCPAGLVNTTTNNCTECASPCATCENLPDECTSCIEGYTLRSGMTVCREEVYWPFPFFAMGFLSFILILISEIVTKRESRFKEAFIAFLSIPEVASWITFTVMVYYRTARYVTLDPVFVVAVLACIMYAIINFVHAIVHPRKIVPSSPLHYKILISDYKCSTFLFRTISYLISYKFSLILVSYFWLRPRLKGDYNVQNWKVFNRISLAFIFLPYPLMMLACIYFLMFDGFFSYPGFVALEVIVITTILMVLMLLDVLSTIRCTSKGKDKSRPAIKVNTGADYESDEDTMKPNKRAFRQALHNSRVDRQLD